MTTDRLAATTFVVLCLLGLGSAEADPNAAPTSTLGRTAWEEMHQAACTGTGSLTSALYGAELNAVLDPHLEPTRGLYGLLQGAPAFQLEQDAEGPVKGADAARWYDVAAQVFCEPEAKCAEDHCTIERPTFGYRVRVEVREKPGGGWWLAGIGMTIADDSRPDRDEKGRAAMQRFVDAMATFWPVVAPAAPTPGAPTVAPAVAAP